MSEQATPLELLFEQAKNYGESTIELSKLTAIDKCADLTSSLVSRLATVTILAMFTLFVNIGISIWLGEYLGKVYYGFLMVACLYLIIGIILHTFRNQWIKMPISNYIITKLLKQK